MIEYENQCVGCQPGMGCIGNSCAYMNVPICYCDVCKQDTATVKIDGYDLCDECAKKHLQEEFDSLTIEEKAEVLGISIDETYD